MINDILNLQERTRIYQGRDGWQGKTTTEANANGVSYEISTYKRRDGVSCEAMEVKVSGNMVQIDVFGAKRWKLASQPGKCTEKKVREVHAAGLVEWLKVKPAPVPAIEVGQIFRSTSGRGSDRVVYAIDPDNSFHQFKTVTIDGKRLNAEGPVKMTGDDSGRELISRDTYTPGDTMSAEAVQELVENAKLLQREASQERERQEDEKQQTKARRVAAGAKVFQSVPAGVAWIMANEEENKSDYQSDYYASHTVEKVYLMPSATERDDFKEMRRAAGIFEPTAYLATAGGEVEKREKYSGGHGYYLGEHRYSGWQVQKVSPPSLESLQENVGLQLEKYGKVITQVSPPEPQPPTPTSAPAASAGAIQVIEYGKGIAVIGDTRPIKDKLKELGGRFNFRLTCGPGWIFPASALPRIQAAFAKPAPAEEDGTSGQDRESYTDEQDRDSYTVSTDEPETPTAEEIAEDQAEQEHEERQESANVNAVGFLQPSEPGKLVTMQSPAGGFFRESGTFTAKESERVKAKGYTEAEPQKSVEQIRAEAREDERVAMQAQGESRAVVVPQVPAPWSPHGAKVEAGTEASRAVIVEALQLAKKANSGKLPAAAMMEQAAEKIARIDSLQAQKTAEKLRTMATQHRAELTEKLYSSHGSQQTLKF